MNLDNFKVFVRPSGDFFFPFHFRQCDKKVGKGWSNAYLVEWNTEDDIYGPRVEKLEW